MALDRALLRRRRIFAAALETTTGTPVALSASDAGFNAFDHDLQHSIEMVDREQQGSASMQTSVPGTRESTLTVRTHLHGAGGSGVALWPTTLLAASNFTAAGSVYSPDTDSEVTITAAKYQDGRFHPLAGCKVDWSWVFKSGFPVDANWTIRGKMLEPSAVALISPTYPTVKPPRFVSGTLTLGGTAYKVSEATLAAGNEIVMREDANDDSDPIRTGDGAGIHAMAIVNRRITLSMDPEALPFGTKNWYQDCLDMDTIALSIVLGSDANNTITIAAPKLQPIDPREADRNGVLVDNINFLATANSSTGDDELTITFS